MNPEGTFQLVQVVSVAASNRIDSYLVRVTVTNANSSTVQATYCQCKGYAYRLSCRHLSLAENVVSGRIGELA